MQISLYFKDLIQIITLQIEQMGNTSVLDNSENFPAESEKEYMKQFKETKTKFGQFTVYSNTKDQFFIGKEIDLPESYGKNLLKKKIIKSQSQTSKVILPIKYFEFHSISTVCSQQQKCLLLSKRPDLDLKQIYLQRKSKAQPFRVSEINSIISRISQALKIQQESSAHIQLDMESILFLDRKAYLLDSLMQNGETFGQSVFGKYRAPETYHGTYNQVEIVSKLLCQLFSLGIIALSLSFININVQTFIYSKSQNGRSKRQLDQLQIKNLLGQLKNEKLTKKLSALLSFNPHVRQQIYDLIKQTEARDERDQVKHSQLNKNNLLSFHQNVDKQNKIKGSILNQVNLINRKLVTIPQKEVLRQNKNCMKITTNCAKSTILNQSVSIVVRSPLKDSNIKKQQRIASLNLENTQLSIYNKRLLQPEVKQTNQRDLPITTTPKKQTKKQQFSTIKEVTEYDDCYSASQSKSITEFQGKTISGKKQGYGILFFKQGSRYQGEWKNDKMHGFGKLFYYGNKLAYEGNWFEGQFHGNGKVYNNQPLVLKESFDYKDFNNLTQEWISYQGQLQHDKRQGWGILKLSNEERFEGEFKQDMLQGFGTFYTLSKQEIRGIWSNSKLIRRQMF